LTDDQETTPTGRPPPVSEVALALATASIALATAANRLESAGELVRRVAVHCAEASRLVDDYGPPDRSLLLRELEDKLATLADDVHEARRKVRASRQAMEHP
jgi:hypothetical protein